MKYRTIVADPPWHVHRGVGFGKRPNYSGPRRNGDSHLGEDVTPYRFMTTDQIGELPVRDMAAEDAHLYLWTINAFIEDAYEIVRRWGFRPAQLLTWAKKPMGIGPGGAFTSTAEFVIFSRRGSLTPMRRLDSTWWQWKRPYLTGSPTHSAKPDGFLDIVEQASPGPYLEMFARRARFGWDYWGDESLGTAEMSA